ncbi:MAG: hypothetical protein K0S46_219 [Moraxellaceae bacterium]|jgi:hypothetical protein|nr:hypothetical protein [Moraxellaceae bacterium]
MKMPQRWQPWLLLLAGMVLTLVVYWPGLAGGWLVDDEANLGGFTRFAAGEAPYRELILGNGSGLLGRSVAMLTFAGNHALGLFSTTALKAGNLLIHLLCGTLLYLLLARLFRLRAPADVSPELLAAVLAAWWLLLPLHISTVLYIVQRMTQVAALFSLASCLAYTVGREALQAGRQRGYACLALSLLVLLPLALLGKESALSTVPWLILIEIFFFRQAAPMPWSPRLLLGGLTLVVLLAGMLVALFPPAFLTEGYLSRDFTLHERLLTQPRVLWTYIGNIFLPNSATMGIFQDDFVVSRSLSAPWTTLPAIALLAALAGLAVLLANSRRWWAIAFGIMFFLSGHLVESTVIPLELFFEHRNYLPAAGLLLAALPLLSAWRWRRVTLAVLAGLYLLVLTGATLQRSHIWGDKHLLLAVSASNHPHSLRAWSDYAEDLLANRRPGEALQAVQLTADRNPRFAGISYLHMLTIICRLNAAPPPGVIDQVALRLGTLEEPYALPLSIGLDTLLSLHQEGHCRNADFSALAPGLITRDRRLQEQLGERRNNQWLLRYNIARWLLETGHTTEARDILRDIWRHFDRAASPPVGLALARTLTGPAFTSEREQVLDELEAVSADAPPDFLDEIKQLRQPATGAP